MRKEVAVIKFMRKRFVRLLEVKIQILNFRIALRQKLPERKKTKSNHSCPAHVPPLQAAQDPAGVFETEQRAPPTEGRGR